MRPANKSNWKSLSSNLYALAVANVVLLTGREPQELFDDAATFELATLGHGQP